MDLRHTGRLDRWAALDLRAARAMHRAACRRRVLAALVLASRLGDGWLWCATILLLPLADGLRGSTCALQMLAVGLVDVGVAQTLKRRFCRRRPFQACEGIRACTSPLDAYSFPSGHTMHAVAFTIVLGWHYAFSAAVALPLTLAIAASRMVLGLHYPSDVAAGAVLGAAAAVIVLGLWP